MSCDHKIKLYDKNLINRKCSPFKKKKIEHLNIQIILENLSFSRQIEYWYGITVNRYNPAYSHYIDNCEILLINNISYQAIGYITAE